MAISFPSTFARPNALAGAISHSQAVRGSIRRLTLSLLLGLAPALPPATAIVLAAASALPAVAAEPAGPLITRQPESTAIPADYTTTFTVWAAGTGTLSYQWFRNNSPISGATNNTYIATAVIENGGMPSYTVQVSDATGTTVSNPVQITVLAPTAPELVWPTSPTYHIGQNGNLALLAPVAGTFPMTFQWYRNGVAIPGATDYAFQKYPTTIADAGTYTLTATNALGTGTLSTPAVVKWDDPGAELWSAQRVGDVVYFLARSPGRIMRYDLAQEAWLPVVALTAGKTPTAFWPTASGTFVAYGAELAWRSANLQTEETVVTAEAAITNLVGVGDAVYYYSYGMHSPPSRKISDRTAGPWLSYLWYPIDTALRPAIAPATNQLFMMDRGPDIYRFDYSADGTTGNLAHTNPAALVPRVAANLFAAPDGQRLFLGNGTVLRSSDLSYAGSTGTGFDRVGFFSDGAPVVMRDRDLRLLDPVTLVETGRYMVPDAVTEIFTRGTAVFAFGRADSASANPVVIRIARASFTLPSPTAPVPANQRISVDNVFIDAGGVINVLSNSLKGVSRWSTTTRSFLPTIPLRGQPVLSNYASAGNRVLLGYTDGTLSRIELNAGTGEQPFAILPAFNGKRALLGMDDLVFAALDSTADSSDLRVVLGLDATLKHLSQTSYWGNYLDWQSASRRAYYIPSPSNDYTVAATTIPADGNLPDATTTWYTALRSAAKVVPPLRFSPDGDYTVSANGKILAGTLASLGQLPNSIVDGTWLPGGLYTLRGTAAGAEIQRWSRTDYSSAGSLAVPGLPMRILRISDTTLAVVTLVNGYVAYHVIPASLGSRESYYSGPVAGAAPTILVRPSSATVKLSQTATFSVVASSGTPLTYQWRKNGSNLTNGGRVSGATTATLTLTGTQPGDTGDYQVVVGNSAGSTTSSAAALTVLFVTGDFTGDARVDSLWQNPFTGRYGLFAMNGISLGDWQAFKNIGRGYRLGAIADFNGDGQSDTLWQNTATGETGIYFMNGTAFGTWVLLGYFDLAYEIVGAADFNGDGKPDTVWQNTATGERGIYLMNGTVLGTWAALGNFAAAYRIAAVADFDGDGKPDTFWENTDTGERGVYLMNGTAFAAWIPLGHFSTDYRVVGAADYNGDGKADTLWVNTVTGERGTYLMNGTGFTLWIDQGYFAPAPAENDFNGDGKPDTLWQNTVTGERGVYLMNGTSLGTWAFLGNFAAAYDIAAIADFNGDGKPDTYWQNKSTGERGIYLMNGTGFSAWIPQGYVATAYDVVGAADFNGDGKPDTLWRNTTTGERGIYLMNGTTRGAWVPLGNFSTQYRIAVIADFNADGKPDTVWQNTVSGECGIYLMNGTAFTSWVPLGYFNTNYVIVAAADYNNDGKTDTVWQNTSSGECGIYLMNGTSITSWVPLGYFNTQYRITH